MERAELARRLQAEATGRESAGSTELVSEANPRRFMEKFAAAAAGKGNVFLGNPEWGTVERSAVDALLTGRAGELQESDASGWLMIPTGGSGGTVRFARHDGATLAAAVEGFRSHFGFARINAIGVLPLFHVSGLMPWLRCAGTGGEFRPWSWKALEGGELPPVPERPDGWCLSLVPTQLERLLPEAAAVDWLRRFRAILIGGAASGPELLDRAAATGLPLCCSYGMTETAAMIAGQTPGEFLGGDRSSGRPLPHARISTAADGTIAIESAALFRGYWPDRRCEPGFVTADRGRIDATGRLHVEGRGDQIIISGGEKIDPSLVETVLRMSGEFDAVAIVGVPDAEWGQVVVAVYHGAGSPDLERVKTLAREHLAPFQRPRHYVAVADWPVAGPGKANRSALAGLVHDAIRSGRAPGKQ